MWGLVVGGDLEGGRLCRWRLVVVCWCLLVCACRAPPCVFIRDLGEPFHSPEGVAPDGAPSNLAMPLGSEDTELGQDASFGI